MWAKSYSGQEKQGYWQLCLQLPERCWLEQDALRQAGGMCCWLSFTASMYRSSLCPQLLLAGYCSIRAAGRITASRVSEHKLAQEPVSSVQCAPELWIDPVLPLILSWGQGRGFQGTLLFVLSAQQHIFVFLSVRLKLTFPSTKWNHTF